MHNIWVANALLILCYPSRQNTDLASKSCEFTQCTPATRSLPYFTFLLEKKEQFLLADMLIRTSYADWAILQG